MDGIGIYFLYDPGEEYSCGETMILKENDTKTASELRDPKLKWGHAAETQMAFYLKRAFASDPRVFVLNDLRVIDGDDVAQIDHLVLLEFGIVIVESKSVTTEVEVNEHGEWSRKTSFGWKGMPSPLLQGKRQYEVLARVLEEIRELKPRVGSQRYWIDQPHEVVAAISDNGRIKRPPGQAIEQVVKAERVPEIIPEIEKRFEKQFLKIFGGTMAFKPDRLQEIGEALLKRHVPRHGLQELTDKSEMAFEDHAPPVAAVLPSSPVISANHPIDVTQTVVRNSGEAHAFRPVCKHCTETVRLEIRFGRGYYIHCSSCEKNSPIKLNCEKDGCARRLRKAKSEFYSECATCGESFLFHRNDAS